MSAMPLLDGPTQAAVWGDNGGEGGGVGLARMSGRGLLVWVWMQGKSLVWMSGRVRYECGCRLGSGVDVDVGQGLVWMLGSFWCGYRIWSGAGID